MVESNNKDKKNNSWPLVGNTNIIEFLMRSLRNDKISGAYIFSGPENLGKATGAYHFAQCLLCHDYSSASNASKEPCGDCPSCGSMHQIIQEKITRKSTASELKSRHGDFYVLEKDKEKKQVAVKEVRELIKALGMSSFLGYYKVAIIRQAETLSLGAANALLKTLEEPKSKVVLILIAKNIDALPKTILSRSQILNFYPVKSSVIYDYLLNTHQTNRSLAKKLSRLAVGRPALAIKFLEDQEYLAAHQAKAELYWRWQAQDINDRLLSLGELLGSKERGPQASHKTKKIIQIWQGVVRDWLLEKLQLGNLTQYEFLGQEMKESLNDGDEQKLLEQEKYLSQAQLELEANVSPQLVLEKIAVSI